MTTSRATSHPREVCIARAPASPTSHAARADGRGCVAPPRRSSAGVRPAVVGVRGRRASPGQPGGDPRPPALAGRRRHPGSGAVGTRSRRRNCRPTFSRVTRGIRTTTGRSSTGSTGRPRPTASPPISRSTRRPPRGRWPAVFHGVAAGTGSGSRTPPSLGPLCAPWAPATAAITPRQATARHCRKSRSGRSGTSRTSARISGPRRRKGQAFSPRRSCTGRCSTMRGARSRRRDTPVTRS